MKRHSRFLLVLLFFVGTSAFCYVAGFNPFLYPQFYIKAYPTYERVKAQFLDGDCHFVIDELEEVFGIADAIDSQFDIGFRPEVALKIGTLYDGCLSFWKNTTGMKYETQTHYVDGNATFTTKPLGPKTLKFQPDNQLRHYDLAENMLYFWSLRDQSSFEHCLQNYHSCSAYLFFHERNRDVFEQLLSIYVKQVVSHDKSRAIAPDDAYVLQMTKNQVVDISNKFDPPIDYGKIYTGSIDTIVLSVLQNLEDQEFVAKLAEAFCSIEPSARHKPGADRIIGIVLRMQSESSVQSQDKFISNNAEISDFLREARMHATGAKDFGYVLCVQENSNVIEMCGYSIDGQLHDNLKDMDIYQRLQYSYFIEAKSILNGDIVGVHSTTGAEPEACPEQVPASETAQLFESWDGIAGHFWTPKIPETQEFMDWLTRTARSLEGRVN